MKSTHWVCHWWLRIFFAVTCVMVGNGFGAEIVWTNIAGGYWSDATNWSPNQVPSSVDTAIITADGNYSVVVVGNRSVDNLTLGSINGYQTLEMNGYLNVVGKANVG